MASEVACDNLHYGGETLWKEPGGSSLNEAVCAVMGHPAAVAVFKIQSTWGAEGGGVRGPTRFPLLLFYSLLHCHIPVVFAFSVIV